MRKRRSIDAVRLPSASMPVDLGQPLSGEKLALDGRLFVRFAAAGVPAPLSIAPPRRGTMMIDHQIIRHPIEIGQRIRDRALTARSQLHPEFLRNILGVGASSPRAQKAF